MNHLVTYAVQENVAVLTVDNPPVNALSPGVAEALEQALSRAASDTAVNAIVLMGAGRTFIAGADISVLQEMAWGRRPADPMLHGLLQMVEDSVKPVVMAIHGMALGGGLELAMAGHYRVALASAQFGQPEVNLGLIPGGEGTQRLPRLTGIETAIHMCVTGKPITASQALAAGLIDAIIEGELEDSLHTGALAFAQNASLTNSKTRDRHHKLGTPPDNAPLFSAGLALAAKLWPNREAPILAVEAIAAATTLPFEEGCARERQIFARCLVSDQAKALIHAFFAERAAAKIPGLAKSSLLPIARVAIVGAGTMGGGIAMACANAGLSVLLKETTSHALQAGLANIKRNYDTSVKRGRLSAHDAERTLALIHPQLDYAGFDSVDLIIEAVFENMALKKQIFQQLDAVARPGCILASNTSTLSIDEIASATTRPEAVIGMHFFSPASVMRLLEVVRGGTSAAPIIATAMALARQLKKVAVLSGNCPGFIGNRMFFPYMYEAQFLLEDGATPSQVDGALTRFGMAMGIFAVDDLVGIDVAWRVRQEIPHFAQPGVRSPLVQDQLFALGRYGQKTAKGWYLYGEDRQPVADPFVEDLIDRSARSAGIVPRTIGDPEILQRCLYSLINEGARLLLEGFALRASDIDVVYLNGYGFPAWRGGPMFYADSIGLDQVLAGIERFHAELGPRWEPAPLLKTLAAEGRGFRDYDRQREA